nr:biotin--protein ligase [Rubrobacter calidifluminis]
MQALPEIRGKLHFGMHGEYKSRGGKLVVADLEIEGGVLRGVRVSGDFFLDPPEALSAITGALEGAPATLAEEELAARIREALPPEAEMVGFSPEAVARAVRRALSS